MMKKKTGFTLVELMVTLVVAAILLTVGVPSFLETIRRNRTTSQANELVTALNLARSEAVKRSMQVTVLRMGIEWEDGWDVFVDEDGDGSLDPDVDALIQKYAALSEGYTLRTDDIMAAWVTFLPSGLSVGGNADHDPTDQNEPFRLCTDEQDKANGRTITINSVGRIAVKAGTTSCP
jgi:type IV fimbrial biogenesis protein FimT